MDKVVADTISKHVGLLAKRPGMFVLEISISNIAIHLDGYFQALFDSKLIRVRNSWSYWVSLRYKKWAPLWSWETILSDAIGSESDVLIALPELISEYLADAIGNGEEAIEQLYSNNG